MPKREDSLLVEDIYQSGVKIQNYTQGYSFSDFIDDERTIDAIIRNFEIIGEAARNLSPILKEKYSIVPWRDMISYRNFLIHDYFLV
jgi:uncharacterized protein with HEPN domain